jgi:hypothetical protein
MGQAHESALLYLQCVSALMMRVRVNRFFVGARFAGEGVLKNAVVGKTGAYKSNSDPYFYVFSDAVPKPALVRQCAKHGNNLLISMRFFRLIHQPL